MNHMRKQSPATCRPRSTLTAITALKSCFGFVIVVPGWEYMGRPRLVAEIARRASFVKNMAISSRCAVLFWFLNPRKYSPMKRSRNDVSLSSTGDISP
jgi:hypothetical protein